MFAQLIGPHDIERLPRPPATHRPRHWPVGRLVLSTMGSLAATRRSCSDHGFADLDRTCALYCALAAALGAYEPIRATLNMGNKEGVFRCLRNTWVDCAPTSERISEHIDHLQEMLRKIMTVSGCVVGRDPSTRAAGRQGRRQRGVQGQGAQAPAC